MNAAAAKKARQTQQLRNRAARVKDLHDEGVDDVAALRDEVLSACRPDLPKLAAELRNLDPENDAEDLRMLATTYFSNDVWSSPPCREELEDLEAQLDYAPELVYETLSKTAGR